MINKKLNKKSQQLRSVLVIIALIIGFFVVGLYSGNGITGASVGLEKVTE